MFFSKSSYLERIQKRTKKGIENSVSDALWKAKRHIENASDEGSDEVKVRYNREDIHKVKRVGQLLAEQGFKVEIDHNEYNTVLIVQW